MSTYSVGWAQSRHCILSLIVQKGSWPHAKRSVSKSPTWRMDPGSRDAAKQKNSMKVDFAFPPSGVPF